MTNNQIASLLTIVLGIMIFILFALVCVYLFIRFRTKKEDKPKEEKVSDKTQIQQLYSVQSIYKFMEFDKVEDNMIVQKNGKRYTMIVKCQGINYDLMSGVEKASVEQGFIQYLNTLRYPIQLYVQTRKVDLTGSIKTYKDRVNTLAENLANKEFEYNQKVRSGRFDKSKLDAERFEVTKARNLYEYGTDIVNSTERMSLNRNILTKNYYVVLSYYPEEAANDVYSEEEVSSIAFSELYTRAQSTISLLSVCGISSKILDSMELVDLLYAAYNRDEAETYDLNKAVNSGFDSLYTTAQDVLEKKMEELDKQIEIDAIQKANEAVLQVKHEREIERQVRETEEDYDDIVQRMAALILESNEDVLGEDIVEDAKERIEANKENSVVKEEKSNENVTTKKYKRAGRPRKTA